MSLSEQIPVLDLDPFTDDFLADPYAHYESLRQAGPVIRLDRYDLWAMGRYGNMVFNGFGPRNHLFDRLDQCAQRT